MTATAPTAPTTPLPPAASTPVAEGATQGTLAASTPWYRRAWVLAIAVALLAVLSFGSGFVAGTATSLFRLLGGGPGTTSFTDGPGTFDGRLPDGVLPGGPGWQTDEQDDGS